MVAQTTSSRYPSNWREIALSIKQRENWHCYRCGVRCLRPGEKLLSAKGRALLIQVHHWDCDPSNNSPENLVALCTVCHLYMHRKHHGSISDGQGMLALAVERQLPIRSSQRSPLVVQLDLWGQQNDYRQLELWELLGDKKDDCV